MEKERTITEPVRRFDPLVREGRGGESDGRYVLDDFAKKEAENRALKEEIRRLKSELEEAKREAVGSPGDILMHSVVDALLHQAKSLSTLVFEHEKNNGPSASH
jgi:hypothetical protein